MFVKDRMSSSVVCVDPDTSFPEALTMMKEKGVRRLPVVRDGKLVGIVTELDLLKYAPSPATSLSIWELNYLLSRLKVSEVMKRDVITVGPDEPIEDAALLMRQHRIGGLPVVRDGEVVGMITETDIFDAFVDMLGLRRGGTRIVVKLRNEVGALHALTGHIKDYCANILSVVTLPVASIPDESYYLAILRVGGGDIPGLIKALDQMGYCAAEDGCGQAAS
ncbi:MAG TPA: CBS domain-containing protein [Clostridia bacterium]|nr:CBS domain-containing protein [Clostridia bacterium]